MAADGVGSIQQAQTTRLSRVFGVAWVHEHTATHQDAVGFSHHGGDPAHIEIFAAFAGFTSQAFVHIALDGRLPETAVGGVDGKFLGVSRHL
jgi:hypothetical protein